MTQDRSSLLYVGRPVGTGSNLLHVATSVGTQALETRAFLLRGLCAPTLVHSVLLPSLFCFAVGNFFAARDITCSEVPVLTPCKTRFPFSFYTRMSFLAHP
jgi:hypothetical protein